MIEIGFLVSAFFAGLLTFLAPCTLPLVPGYLAFISGTDQKSLEDPKSKKKARSAIFWNGVFFVIGFSAIFILFGTLAGLLGQALVPYRIWLTRIGGFLVVLFGLFMLGVLKLPFLQSDKRIQMPKWLTVGKKSSSLIVGGAFAFGWTPCVGPILGSILLLSISSATALQGAVLLFVFSLGLAIPFLLVAFAVSRATKVIKNMAGFLKWISVIGGIFLIILGILLMMNQFGITIELGYRLLDFLHYDKILEYL